MEIPLFIKGVLVGVGLSAPVGPVAVLCLKRTLTHGRLNGFVTGLGAAASDVVYGLLAALGVTALSQFLLDEKRTIQVVGGFLLVLLGLYFRHSMPVERKDNPALGLHTDFLSAFAITVSNPLALLGFATAYSALGIVHPHTRIPHAGLLTAGVATGAVCWWGFLTLAAGRFRDRLGPELFHRLNRITGTLIVILGAAMTLLAL